MSQRPALADKIRLPERGDAFVDPQLWYACAGSLAHIPQVGSSVLYFPQGHGEHAFSPPDFPRGFSSSAIPCRVLSVKFLADVDTDEVYAHIALHPGSSIADRKSFLDLNLLPQPVNSSKVASFAKTLTQSDANNGGGFSVPRYCAETIFPRLDYNEDPPVQIVLAKDVHGNVWKFRHIYRGTPRRHLLTTGWSSFVNRKKLVAGDAIVFLRGSNGELRVGVRRSTRSIGTCGTSIPWHQHCGISALPAAAGPPNWDANSSQGMNGFLDIGQRWSSLLRSKPDIPLHNSNFARNRARVTPKSVLEAATIAATGKPFEVLFYPRATVAEFCVQSQSVRASLQQNWAPGIRLKMALETEDASRISWYMGTVSKVEEADPILWPSSPWKMLLVTWDEPDSLQGITRVSPWQVELVSPPVQPSPFSFPRKRLRLSQPAHFLLDGQDYVCAALPEGIGEMSGLTNPRHGFVDSIPAGMQGARHGRNHGLSFQMPMFSSVNYMLNGGYQHQGFPQIGEVIPAAPNDANMQEVLPQGCGIIQHNPPTKLTIRNNAGNNSQSQQSLSTGSGNEREGLERKKGTFVLFGKTIDTTQSINAQQPQVSSDSSINEEMSDGIRSEVCDEVYRFFTDMETPSRSFKVTSLVHDHQDLGFSGSHYMDNCQLPPRQLVGHPEGGASNNGFSDCKVFSKTDDADRTVDLSKFFLYEQLYEALENMYGVQKFDFLDRVVPVDSMGYSKAIGDVPYWDFMQRVKKLKILTESSRENMTKEV